jgi:cysteinyl-tRNA synthetase
MTATLSFHNTLTRTKETFVPLDPSLVRMYVCGPTVYDYAHIGNARPAVVFDVLFRLLRYVYGPGHVIYARNITDVDDKIIEAARTGGESIAEVTERTTRHYHEDMAALNALAPTVEPRCTGHIPEMVAMIETLIAAGHAYEAESHVLFDVASWPDYGGLSRRSLEDMIAGARVEVAPYKRNPQDFVMWKPAKEGEPGWDSPWGRGRPGWHIECSAMAEAHLGETFDIHGGGLDLIFPHHENEIAQSVCAHHGHTFVRTWMHNGYVTVNGEKMSKSLGNFYTVHDLLKEFPGEAIRLALLSAQYRQPLDFSREKIAEQRKVLDRWYRALETLGEVDALDPPEDDPRLQLVLDALADDLNTPLAIAGVNALVDDVFDGPEDPGMAKGRLRAAGQLLGLLEIDAVDWFHWHPAEGGGPGAEEIEALIEERLMARKAKDFATADRIRDDLAAQGVQLEDGPDGTTWRRS